MPNACKAVSRENKPHFYSVSFRIGLYKRKFISKAIFSISQNHVLLQYWIMNSGSHQILVNLVISCEIIKKFASISLKFPKKEEKLHLRISQFAQLLRSKITSTLISCKFCSLNFWIIEHFLLQLSPKQMSLSSMYAWQSNLVFFCIGIPFGTIKQRYILWLGHQSRRELRSNLMSSGHGYWVVICYWFVQ